MVVAGQLAGQPALGYAEGMQITCRQEFAASPQATHAMLTNQAFLAQSARSLGAERHDVMVADAGSTRVLASVPSPPQVKAFVGERMDVVQESTWGPAAEDGTRTGSFRFTVAGAPVELSCTTRLAPGGPGTVVEYAGTLSVKIPLVGPMVEKASAPAFVESLATQERTGAAWLARSPG